MLNAPVPNTKKLLSGAEFKIFDPRDPSSASCGAELLDSSVAKRGDRWWMYLAGQAEQVGAPDIFSATLPAGAPLTATGWKPAVGEDGKVVPVAERNFSSSWDGGGGRHCPSYVKGWNPQKRHWVERLYHAGAAENIGGPYTIGFLEWDGTKWSDQAEPAFIATETWERGSVFEPNLIYHDGKWKLWYVAGSTRENYLVHGYSESEDGATNWANHRTFAPPEMNMFDFCVRQRGSSYDAIFSRVSLTSGTPPPETGLWWSRAKNPSANFADWSKPVQIMTAEDRQWHSGPFKPSFQFHEQHPDHAFVFFDGMYRTDDPGPFPFAFTLGCNEIDLPEGGPTE